MRFFPLAAAFLFPLAALAQPLEPPTQPRLDSFGPITSPGWVTVTELPASPRLNAMGYAGVALWTEDPHAFLLNPAHLGALGRDGAVMTSGWPGAQDWEAPPVHQVGTAALGAGADLARWGVPLHAGLGVARTSLTRGDDREAFTAVGAGVGTRGRVALSAGATVRFGEAAPGPRFSMCPPSCLAVPPPEGRFTSFDVGARLALPLLELVSPPAGPRRPFLDVAVGYARTGMGGSVTRPAYGSPWGGEAEQELPVDQLSRLGFGWTAGLRGPLAGREAEWFAVELATQAERYPLIPTASWGAVGSDHDAYSFRDDLTLIGPAFTGGSRGSIRGRTGLRLRALDTAELAWGWIGAGPAGPEHSHGWTVRPLGLLRAFGAPEAARFAERYDVAVTRSVYPAGRTDRGTVRVPLTGVSVTVRP